MGIKTRAESSQKPNPFSDARARLNLSQRELAERLGTSHYALVRWEQGDISPTPDILSRLEDLADPDAMERGRSGRKPGPGTFASTGARAASRSLPLFASRSLPVLAEPRPNLLEGLVNGDLWADGDLAIADMLSRRSSPAGTRGEALGEAISAGKNTYTYDAHTYHTKVPPQGIASVISRYLPNGGLVLDPFAGSGMTGVAARTVGADVILNELSPAASFIAYNFTRNIDLHDFNDAILGITSALGDLRTKLYTTECRECGKETEQLYTVWSYELECNRCTGKFVLWDHCRKYGNNVREHKLLKRFPCPCCGHEVNKSYLKRHGVRPVFVGYRCCRARIVEHPLLPRDQSAIQAGEAIVEQFRKDVPDVPLPEGVNLSQPRRHGLDTVAKFYTSRNLSACAAIWREIRRVEDHELACAAGFAFTSLYQRVTRLSEYRFWGGSGNTANFNVPHISNESNVFVTFERKAKSIADHFATTMRSYGGRVAVRTGSATDLTFLPDDSIDFIFTDPPFGGNINYSEMNILWEAWLGRFTDSTDEAIANKFQGKSAAEYERLMERSLKEACRVLRPGHWMVLVFMNSSETIWNALRSAIAGAGFKIEETSIFDKQHGTFKQFVSENAAGADVMLHCRKPNGQDVADPAAEDASDLLTLSDFVNSQLTRLPMLPFLHVRRKSEIDYRTLYSRYISLAMQRHAKVPNFSDFRERVSSILEEVRQVDHPARVPRRTEQEGQDPLGRQGRLDEGEEA